MIVAWPFSGRISAADFRIMKSSAHRSLILIAVLAVVVTLFTVRDQPSGSPAARGSRRGKSARSQFGETMIEFERVVYVQQTSNYLHGRELECVWDLLLKVRSCKSF